MADELLGRVGVVTGAGTGLGSAIARALAAAGVDLMLHVRASHEGVQQVLAACRDLGRRADLFTADFAADPAGGAKVVEEANARYGRVDILVNNAAVTTKRETFELHSLELFEEILRVNVTAPFLATQAAARSMIAAGNGGRIINIGSVHGRQGSPGTTAYDTSKRAIEALTYSSAIELGRHGITVNCVAPGLILHDQNSRNEPDDQWSISRTPIGRNGRPDDIAALVRFLAGDDAGFITGETIVVDGGMTRRMPLVR